MHNDAHVKITLDLDEALIREAGPLTGLRSKPEVVHEGLRTLITRESARRLAAVDGFARAAKAPRRRRVPTSRLDPAGARRRE
jgi:Arc/MetJ family transcription regulator